ncbi:DUF4153 domain-containing protein [Pontibacter mangrovi]|uniref:DUF4153 domain-containing protein n=1 Tax=Pontibacter mangrovi TaxID=2589816 RepID=A0A501W9Y3_9BACT|nr:DUF4153 domain-containing protein [Pontibacter mangrovi]TPE43627.1 DUF4153 domain-containing protein [Pontibacter mangrovi]
MGFFKNLSLQQLWQGAAATFLRYPLALLSAFTGTAAAMWLTELDYDQRQHHLYLGKLILVCALGLILFFTLELLVRRYRLSLRGRVLLRVLGLALLVLYYWFLPEELLDEHWLRFLMLALALHLAASYVMFFHVPGETAFWQFNKALFLRILTSGLYAAVLYLGLIVALLAVDNLFAVQVDGETYTQLWFFMVGVFNTWFFLAGVPADVQLLEVSPTYPRGLKVFTQFVLLPLVTLYLVILYAYFGKIVVEWAWPEGWVSVLVLCFSVVGILSLLLIHPIRFEEGNTWMRTFSKWFYRALFPLVILLALAIWRRVAEYGITEERYIVMVLAIWLFATALYFLFSRHKHIKFIPITLSLVALLAAYGPLNAFQVSQWSQVYRLEKLLEQNRVLVNGKVQRQHSKVSEAVEREVSSITDYLARHQDLEVLQPWFAVDLQEAFAAAAAPDGNRWQRSYAARDTVLHLMGLEYRTSLTTPDEQYFYFSTQPYDGAEVVHDIKGYTYALEFGLRSFEGGVDQREYQVGKAPLLISMKEDATTLYFQFEQETLSLDLLPLIKKLGAKGQDRISPEKMTFVLKGKDVQLKVVLAELSGRQKKQKYAVQSLLADVFVAPGP